MEDAVLPGQEDRKGKGEVRENAIECKRMCVKTVPFFPHHVQVEGKWCPSGHKGSDPRFIWLDDVNAAMVNACQIPSFLQHSRCTALVFDGTKLVSWDICLKCHAEFFFGRCEV